MNVFVLIYYILIYLKNIAAFFGIHNTCPIKHLYTVFLAIIKSSNKSMLHNERKDYFLGLVEVSLNKTYKHVKAKDNV